MESNAPFRPGGSCFLLVGKTTPAAGDVVRAPGPDRGDVTYLVYNAGAAGEDVFLAYGASAAAALANGVVPVAGTNGAVLQCPAGTIQTFSLTGALYFCGISLSGSPNCYITPGYGS